MHLLEGLSQAQRQGLCYSSVFFSALELTHCGGGWEKMCSKGLRQCIGTWRIKIKRAMVKLVCKRPSGGSLSERLEDFVLSGFLEYQDSCRGREGAEIMVMQSQIQAMGEI